MRTVHYFCNNPHKISKFAKILPKSFLNFFLVFLRISFGILQKKKNQNFVKIFWPLKSFNFLKAYTFPTSLEIIKPRSRYQNLNFPAPLDPLYLNVLPSLPMLKLSSLLALCFMKFSIPANSWVTAFASANPRNQHNALTASFFFCFDSSHTGDSGIWLVFRNWKKNLIYQKFQRIYWVGQKSLDI